MAQRINALVHGGMSAEEAAEVIGIDASALVQHGNGYAVINPRPAPAEAQKASKPKPKPKPVKTSEVEMDPALDS